MALGGGVFTAQNKILPGSYINVISTASVRSTMGERGVIALPIALKWGKEGEVMTVTAEEFTKNSTELFGYAYDAPEMLELREVFKHAQKALIYNTAVGGTKAKDEKFEATRPGSRGNDIKYVVEENLDDSSKIDITIYLGNTVVDKQTVTTTKAVSEYVNNEYVTCTAAPTVTAGKSLTGGADGTTDASSIQAALNAFESYTFNVLLCPSTDNAALFVEYTKRMRDQKGVKFQTVVPSITNADYEGVVQIPEAQAGAIYWVAGALAGCEENKSCTNMTYDGEVTIPCAETQTELENYIESGVFAFHKVETEVRVLMDINSLVTYSENKNDLFSSNQVIRVCDGCAMDAARIFNTKYLGKVQNDASGRISFWSDIVSNRRERETMRAIEAYDSEALTVEQGKTKNSVVVNEVIVPISAMEKLYMTIVIN